MTTKQIALGALSGWSAIVGLAWWLARARIDYCPSGDFSRCRMRQIAASDSILIGGLTVALAGAIVMAVILRMRDGRLDHTFQPDNRGLKQVRSKVAATLGQKSRFLARLVERGGLKHLQLMLAVAMMLSTVVWIGSRDHGGQYPQTEAATEAATEVATEAATEAAPNSVEMPAEEAMSKVDPYGAIAAPVIPVAFRGEWNSDTSACGTNSNDSRLIVFGRKISFWESDGDVKFVWVHTTRAITVSATYAGEGQVWDRSDRLVLSRSSNDLTITSADGNNTEASTFTRHRCPR